MKHSMIVFLILISAFILFAGVTGNNGETQLTKSVPNMIDYQGRITDGSNNPITTPVSIAFAIYDNSVDGTELWSETHTSVTPVEGLVHVLLGSESAFASDLFDGSERWLGITVGGDGEMTPRLRIVSSPYSIYANNTDNLDGHDSNFFVSSIGDTMTGTLVVNVDEASDYAVYGSNPGSFGCLGPANIGVYGYSNTSGPFGAVGTFGVSEATIGNNFGVRAEASGITATTNFGIYSTASSASSNYGIYSAVEPGSSNWAGYFDGNVNIQGDFYTSGITHDSDGDAGTSGQVLSSTSTGTDWVDAGTGVIGINDLTDGKTGTNSVFLGLGSGASNTGSNNAFLGVDSGINNSSGLANTFIGRASGHNNSTGNFNTYLGYYSGLNSNGSSNVFLGQWAGANEAGSNKLYIENSNAATPLIYGEFDNNKIVINGEFQATGITRDSGGDAGTSGQVLSSTSSGTDWVDVSSTHFIGENYGGGIVFYVYDNGKHGLIAATEDQGYGLSWNNGTYRYTGTNGDGLYAGIMNTAMIVATQIADNQIGYFAAKICADYSVTVGGVTYGDWYLPSKYELNLLYLQKAVVGCSDIEYYWSSTESNDESAWYQYFGDGYQNYKNKTYTYSAWAIRAF